MNGSCFIISARRGIIWIGKYAPFVIVFIVTLSNVETLYSVTTDRYAMFDGMIIYYKPISWWIGERFELSIAWIVSLFVLSFGVEACAWLEHTIDETSFAVVLIANSTIGTLLVIKGIKIMLK